MFLRLYRTSSRALFQTYVTLISFFLYYSYLFTPFYSFHSSTLTIRDIVNNKDYATRSKKRLLIICFVALSFKVCCLTNSHKEGANKGGKEGLLQWNKYSPSLVIFKTHLDAYLCNLLCGTALARGLDLMISWGAFQPPRFCEKYVHIWSTKILSLNILNMLEMLLKCFILISITFGDSCCHSSVVSLTPFSSDLFVTPLLSHCNSKMVNIQLLN